MFVGKVKKVNLFVGWQDKEGHHKEIQIRELTGEEEALILSAADKPQAYRRILNDIIASCIYEEIPLAKRKEIVASLKQVDRDYLMVQIRILSFGDDYEMTGKCPECGREIDISFSLEKELKVIEPKIKEEKFTIKLDAGIPYLNGPLKTISCDVGKMHLEADEVSVMVSKAIQSAIVEADGVPGSQLSTDIINRMTWSERHKILKEINARVYRLPLEVDVECDGCGKVSKLPLNMKNFFRFE